MSIIMNVFNQLTHGEPSIHVDILKKQYNAAAHPRVVARHLTEAAQWEYFCNGMAKHQLDNGFLTLEGFIEYYLDASCMLPADKDQWFQQAICSVWSINNANGGADTRSADYVSTARINQLEDIICEKIRQKTHGAEDEGKTVKKIFKHFDIEGYGTITCQEFTKAIETLGCYFTPIEINALFKKHDTNKSGKLDFEEFAGWVACRGAGNNPNVKNQFRTVRAPPKECLDKIRAQLRMKGMNGMRSMITLFRKFDVNGDNRLDRHEISWLLKQNGHFLSESEFEQLFRYFDKNNDGVLTLSELINGVRGQLSEARTRCVKEAW